MNDIPRRQHGSGKVHVLLTKEKVYDQIMQYLKIERYPTEEATVLERIETKEKVYHPIMQ